MQLAINNWSEVFIRFEPKVMSFPQVRRTIIGFLEGVFLFNHVVLLDESVSSAHLLILRSIEVLNLVPVHVFSCETVLNG